MSFGPPSPPPSLPFLMGSNVLPSSLSLGGKTVPLGKLVRAAFRQSGLTADQWNNLPELDRDLLLVRHYHEMKERRFVCRCGRLGWFDAQKKEVRCLASGCDKLSGECDCYPLDD